VNLTVESPDGTLDRSEVVADVAAAFGRYEQALVAGDVATLTELFWDDERCVRFGVADRQRGAAEIAAWRREHPTVPPGRTLRDTTVVPLGDDAAVVTTLFHHPGGAIEGRQSQTWCRFPQGWRIVAAHVSEVPLR
jgi:hypothetical protein